MKSALEKTITEETERRLAEMSGPDYPWPKRIGIADMLGIGLTILVCLALIALCAEGVIV